MAYQIKKTGKIVEDLELLNDNNEVDKVIHVDIDIDHIAKDFRKAQTALITAQKAVSDGAENALETYGNAVIDVFNLIFGNDNTVDLLNYFDGKYTDMAIQIMPFVSDIITPAVEKAVKSKKELLANNYGLTAKQRKKLGL